MTSCRRQRYSYLLLVSAILTVLLAAGCKPDPTTIIGSVSYLNTTTMNRPFPPAGHSGTVDDDVAYARLVDNGGAGAAIWESPAFDAGNTLLPFDVIPTVPTSKDGVNIASFVITLTDAQVSGATMPLRLEVYLYDTPVAAGFPALDPATDPPNLYSYFDANGEGDRQWYSLIDIRVNEVKHSYLSATMPTP